tara:strand:- start:1509 stop:2132 length:624 start_codon:yes stop_codon:yes gene_type:complete
MNTKTKLLFHLSILLISLIISLLFTYAYFNFWQHDRYYEGTISSVEKKEIKIIKGLATIIDPVAEKNIQAFSEAFQGLSNKLAVKITLDGGEVYSNIQNKYDKKKDIRYFKRELKNKTKSFPLGQSKYIIHVDTYLPPKWSTKFWRWFKHPEIWFTSSFDWLTVIFLMFSAIFYLISLAGLWAYQSKVLSKDIRPLLVELAKQKNQK